MKRFFILACLALIAAGAQAQKLSVGDRAPEIRANTWLTAVPQNGNRVRYVEFFHSRSAPSVERLPDLDRMAETYAGRMDVIVVCREDAVTVARTMGGDRKFYIAVDEDARTFAAYDAQYLPFGAVIDPRGRVVWLGNPGKLTEEELSKHLK